MTSGELRDAIQMDKGWFDPVMEKVRAYHFDNPTFGSLHVVLDAGNLDRENVSFCAGWAAAKTDNDAIELIDYLRLMTAEQRRRVYRGIWG